MISLNYDVYKIPDNHDLTCTVCFEPLTEEAIAHSDRGEKHPLHKGCMIRWVKSLPKNSNPDCPTCRLDINSKSLGIITASQEIKSFSQQIFPILLMAFESGVFVGLTLSQNHLNQIRTIHELVPYYISAGFLFHASSIGCDTMVRVMRETEITGMAVKILGAGAFATQICGYSMILTPISFLASIAVESDMKEYLSIGVAAVTLGGIACYGFHTTTRLFRSVFHSFGQIIQG